MYTIDVSVIGTAPILQHKFGSGTLEGLMNGANKRTGAKDYSLEWLETLYSTANGFLYQPASHFEGAMVKAAARFKVAGKNRTTYKDAFRAYVFVSPDEILHMRRGETVPTPTADLLTIPQDGLEVNVMRVVVQRSAVARSRLMICDGWELNFQITVIEEQVQAHVVQTVLEEAGRAVGIGDYRPRYGRFSITKFEVT